MMKQQNNCPSQLLAGAALLFISYTYMIIIQDEKRELQMVNVQNDTFVFQRFQLPKYYATVNQVKEKSEIDYRHSQIDLGDWNDYEFDEEIGSGASGTAYMGKKISTGQIVVIKTFFDEARVRSIKREIKLLRTVQDHPYITELVDVIEAAKTGFISLVYNYYENTPTIELFSKLTDKGNKFFMYKVLKGLDYAHSRGVIHGDMKPANIIVNPETQMLKIIDWGLGRFYVPGIPMSVHIGTKSYKTPELLLGYQFYDHQVDVFSTGLMFSKMLFRKGPFFNTSTTNWTEVDHLDKIAKVLGTESINKYIDRYKIKIDEEKLPIKSYQKHQFSEYINQENKKYCSDEAIDLLTKMLIIDHAERINTKDALEHPYFDEVKNLV